MSVVQLVRAAHPHRTLQGSSPHPHLTPLCPSPPLSILSILRTSLFSFTEAVNVHFDLYLPYYLVKFFNTPISRLFVCPLHQFLSLRQLLYNLACNICYVHQSFVHLLIKIDLEFRTTNDTVEYSAREHCLIETDATWARQLNRKMGPYLRCLSSVNL